MKRYYRQASFYFLIFERILTNDKRFSIKNAWLALTEQGYYLFHLSSGVPIMSGFDRISLLYGESATGEQPLHSMNECPECGNRLAIHQPEIDSPYRMIGTCNLCHTWILIDLYEFGDPVVTKLPMRQ